MSYSQKVCNILLSVLLFVGIIGIYTGIAFFYSNVFAIENTNSNSSSILTSVNNTFSDQSEILNLGTPIYVENYVVPDNSSKEFTGEGKLFGKDVVVANGTSTFTPRDNDSIYINGKALLAISDGNIEDIAPYTFQAIGHSFEDGSFENTGVAIFDNITSGGLVDLSNVIGLFKGKTDAEGKGTFVMWELK